MPRQAPSGPVRPVCILIAGNLGAGLVGEDLERSPPASAAMPFSSFSPFLGPPRSSSTNPIGAKAQSLCTRFSLASEDLRKLECSTVEAE